MWIRTIDFCTDHFIPYGRMDRIGKINRRRAGWKIFDISGRRKTEYRI